MKQRPMHKRSMPRPIVPRPTSKIVWERDWLEEVLSSQTFPSERFFL